MADDSENKHTKQQKQRKEAINALEMAKKIEKEQNRSVKYIQGTNTPRMLKTNK